LCQGKKRIPAGRMGEPEEYFEEKKKNVLKFF
jgi:hypothetical protein